MDHHCTDVVDVVEEGIDVIDGITEGVVEAAEVLGELVIGDEGAGRAGTVTQSAD